MRSKTLLVFLFLCSSSFHLFSEGTGSTGELKLKPHPRLWVSQEDLDHLKNKVHSPHLKGMVETVLEDAEWLVSANLIQETDGGTYQQGTRAIASRLKNLTMAWAVTGEKKFRSAAMKNLENMMNWDQISCEARRGMGHEPLMYFCLSAGEHAADIALMYDLFAQDITPEEKKIFNDVLDRFYLRAALNAKDRPPWWANKEWSNWNGVCAGGIGLLALAFYDERPEARSLIPFVEKSLSHYFRSYITNGGGNHEGTGYWNYGMHYAIRYLLSWEQATGKKHAAFDIPEIGKSLHFPVDFTKINFGDNDGWHPSGFFFMMANRTGQSDVIYRAAAHVYKSASAPKKKPHPKTLLSRVSAPDFLYAVKYIPTQASMEELHKSRQKVKLPFARVYEGLGWAAMADDTVFPSIRLGARGGSNRITGHGHIDVMSFKCRVNDMTLIEDQRGGGYSPVTFTGRGHHVYSRSAAAKSGLFVFGLSPMEDYETKSVTVHEGEWWKALRLDGTGLYLPRWRRRFVGRLFLMVDNAYFVIVDGSSVGGGLESRFHTYGELKNKKDWATFKRGNESLTATFASLGRGRLTRSQGTPEHMGRPTKILRWFGNSDVQVSALIPGVEKIDLQLKRESGGVSIQLSGNGITSRSLKVSRDLKVLQN